jgi:hypothetical protein
MRAKPPNLYRLRVGEVYDDLSVYNFVDVLWQAFDKDKLKSLTIELSRMPESSNRITMRVLHVKRKRRTKKQL